MIFLSTSSDGRSASSGRRASGVVGHVLHGHEVSPLGVDVDQAREELVVALALLEEPEGRDPVGDVVLLVVQRLEGDPRAVVELHAGRLAGLLLDLDLGQPRDEAHLVERLLVLLGPVPALGRAVEVVEGDARADDVEHRGPLVLEGGLQERDHLLLVAGERPRHERGPADDRLGAQVERRQCRWPRRSARRRCWFRSAVAENCPLVRP